MSTLHPPNKTKQKHCEFRDALFSSLVLTCFCIKILLAEWDNKIIFFALLNNGSFFLERESNTFT